MSIPGLSGMLIFSKTHVTTVGDSYVTKVLPDPETNCKSQIDEFSRREAIALQDLSK